MNPVLRTVLCAAFLVAAAFASPARAQDDRPGGSRCIAMAERAPATIRAAWQPAPSGLPFAAPAAASGETNIRFVGHATFLITSPGGVTIATDYSGMPLPTTPRVATMNRAHISHWTPDPNPGIEYVLKGWPEDGRPASHHLQVGDVLIRNVTTDIRGGSSGRVPDGNSIFIFETGGLCIGHLGHLHHVLEPADLAWIGQLDVVMVPVDGSYTMAQESMVETLKVLKARLILPMHYFGPGTLARFVSELDEAFDVETSAGPEITVSPATLPETTKVLVLPGY